ncbi:MAG: 50S ribosomal protein L24 [Deferribacteraceae bacterium]|jgi:large subunit ribosomal protein L24|nr:50S ribosomal protein L24 [Deferribacteraceae bacterium]
MPVKYKIRKGDPVVIITGKNKVTPKQNLKLKGAKVVSVDRENGKVVVENVNVVKRHTRPNQIHPNGGIIEKAMPIDISNVMYCCPKCDKGVRLGSRILENGRKTRFCKSCGEVIDKD